jgi:hypothetical protein
MEDRRYRFSYQDPPYKVRQALFELFTADRRWFWNSEAQVVTAVMGISAFNIADLQHRGAGSLDRQERNPHANMVHGETTWVHHAVSGECPGQHQSALPFRRKSRRLRIC